MQLALEIVTLVLGGVAMLIVLPDRRARARVRSRPVAPLRPEDLERLERLVVTGRSSAAEVHLRLRPLLSEIAAARLSRRGIRLDRSPSEARASLGDQLWDVVRPDRPRPEHLRGPGISVDELTQMIERLERL